MIDKGSMTFVWFCKMKDVRVSWYSVLTEQRQEIASPIQFSKNCLEKADSIGQCSAGSPGSGVSTLTIIASLTAQASG